MVPLEIYLICHVDDILVASPVESIDGRNYEGGIIEEILAPMLKKRN